jgi:hypothetical protein
MRKPLRYFGQFRIPATETRRSKLVSTLLHQLVVEGKDGPRSEVVEGEGRWARRRLYDEAEVMGWLAANGYEVEPVPYEPDQEVYLDPALATIALNEERKKVEALQRRLEAQDKRITELHHQLAHQTFNFAADRIVSVVRMISVPVRSFIKCGVYFLLHGERIVYVGQSVNVLARLAQHMKDKEFDSFALIECGSDELDELEGFYIRLLQPALNRSGRTGTMVAPLSLRHSQLGVYSRE